MFELGGPEQAPDGCLPQVDHRLLPHRHGVAGDEHQPGVGEPVVGEPGPQGVQDAVGGGAGLRRDVGVRVGVAVVPGAADRHDQCLGRRLAPGEQVGEGVGVEVGADPGAGGLAGGAEGQVVAEHHPPGGGGDRPRGYGHRRPVHLEQRLVPAGAGGAEGVPGDPPHDQRSGVQDGGAGGVGDLEGDADLAGRGDAHPQGGGAGGEQGHPGPGEREPGHGGVGAVAHPAEEAADGHGLQSAVEQRRVDAEATGLGVVVGGQFHLGEDLVPAGPGGAQAAEHGAVAEDGRLDAGVEGVGLHRGGARRRPDAEVEGGRFGGPGGEQAGGVAGPGHVGEDLVRPVAVRARVQLHGAAARLVALADGELHLEGAEFGQDQRGEQGELLHHGRAGLLAGVGGEFHEGGAGQQDGVHHPVLAEPRVGTHRQPPGEHHPLAVGEGDRGAEQRVAGVLEAGGGDVLGPVHGRVEPEPLLLEGVGGQVDGAGLGEDLGEVHREAEGVRGGQVGEQAGGVVLAAAQGADRVAGGAGVVEDRGDRHGEHRVRGDFDERRVTRRDGRADRRVELDGPAQVVIPVLGAHRLRVHPGSGQRRHETDVPRLRGDIGQVGTELFGDLLHRRRVRRVVHRDQPGTNPVGLTRLHQIGHGLRRPGHHHRGRAVHRRDPDPREAAGVSRTGRRLTRHCRRALARCGPGSDAQARGHLRRRQVDRGHRPGAGQHRQRPRPQRHRPRRVLQRQDPRHTRRADLALRVPDHHLRGHADVLPHRRQGHPHRPQHRLHDLDPVQPRLVVTAQHRGQIHIQIRRQRRLALGQLRVEHRRAAHEARRHPRRLRTLTGEHENRTRAVTRRRARHDAPRGHAAGQRVQPGHQLLDRRADHHGAVVERRPGGGQRPAHRRRVRVPVLPDVRGQPGGLPGQGPTRPGRHRPHRHVCVNQARTARDRGGRLVALLDDDVGVGAGDAEGGHRRAARPPHRRPRPGLGDQLHGPGRPVDVRRRLVHVQGGRHEARPNRLHHLDHTGHPGGGLRVPDVGLDRAEQQRPTLAPVLPVRGDERLRLDGVAQRRAGAVRLHHIHVGRREPGRGESLPDHPLLRRPVGGGQPVGRAVLVDRGAADHGEHVAALPAGVGEPLDQQQADALGPAGAVGRGGEGLAPAVGGQAALPGELHEGGRGGHHDDATGEREVALAAAQRLAGPVQRDEGGRAGGVERDRRTLEPEGVRHPAGDDAAGHPGERVAGGLLRRVRQQGAVVLAAGADEHAGAAATHGRRVDAGRLEGLPGGLQQQALLRVHGQGLTGADAEEARVEPVDAGEEAAAAGVEGARGVRVGAVEGVQVPAPVGGQVGDGVDAVGDQPPQLLRGRHPAGQPAGHADDGERFVVADGHGGGHRPGRGGGAADLGAEVNGQVVRARVVEDQGGGQAHAERVVQPVAHLDGGERVEPELAERPARLDGGRVRVAEHGGGLAADDLDQRGDPVGVAQRGELLHQGRPGGRERRGAPAAADQRPVQGRDGAGELHPHGGEVEAGRDERRVGRPAGGVEEGQALLGLHGGHAGAGDPVEVDVVQLGGHAAAVGPEAPGEGERGQPAGPAVVGQPVEERVGGGVVALAGAAGRGRERRVRDERGEVEVGGQLVQVPGGVHLRPQDVVHPLRRERGDHAVVADAGGVDDGGERVRRRDRGEQVRDGGPVGDVAGGDGDGGAQRLQVGAEFGDPGGGPAAPAGEDQVADAVLCHQVPAHQLPEGAGGAGDQDGAVAVERGGGRLGESGDPGEAGARGDAGPDGELRLVGGDRRHQRGGGAGHVVDVDQHEPVGVLRLGGPQQADHGGAGQVGEVGVLGGGDRAPGQHHQAGRRVPVVGEEPLEHVERPVGGLRHGPRHVGRPGRVEEGHHQHAGDVRAVVERRGQGVQPGVRRRGRAGGREGVGEAGVIADDRPGDGRRGGGRGERRPLHPVQRLGVAAPRHPELVGGDGPQDEGADGDDRSAGDVGQQQRDAVGAGVRDADPGRRRAGGVQGHVVPGERQPAVAGRDGRPGRGATGRGEAEGVQRRVEQRRVQAVRVGLGGGRLGQRQFGEEIVPAPPGRAQRDEGRAVVVAPGGEVPVQVVGGDLGRAGGRPGGQVGPAGRPARGGRPAGQYAAGVAGPGALAVGRFAVRGGVQRHRPAAGVVGGADPELDVDAAGLREDERRLQGEFPDVVRADVRAGLEGEFDEAGAGQQHGVEDDVVGDPRVRTPGQPPGEQEALGVRDADGRAEQRVPGGAQADRGDVAGPAAARLRPVAPVLEGVGGQVYPAGAGAGEPGLPVDRDAVHVQVGEGGEQGVRLGSVLALDGDGEEVLVVGQRVGGEGGQDALRADLQEGPGAGGRQRRDAVGVPDGPADVPDPVVRGADLRAVGEGAGEVGDDRQQRRRERQPVQDGAEPLQHRLHQRAVERVAHRQATGPRAALAPDPPDLVQDADGAGDDHRGRTVDGGDVHPGQAGDRPGHLVLGGGDRQHATTGRQRLHQPAPRRDEGARVRQGQHPRHVRRRDLPDRVPAHEVRHDPERLDQPEQRHLDGEQAGLGEFRLVQQVCLGRAFGGEQHRLERLRQQRIQVRAHLVQGGGEHRERLGQFAAHAGALRALTGEEHGQVSPVGRLSRHHGARRRVRRERPQRGQEVVAAGRRDHGPPVEGGPRGDRRERHVQGPQVGLGVKPSGPAARLRGERGGVAGRHRHRHDRADGRRRGVGRRGLRLGGLFEDGVRVGAGDAERGDRRAAGPVHRRPRGGLGDQFDGAGVPVDLRGRGVHVQGGRDDAVPHRHHHLDHPGDAGRGLGVPEVGLDRAEQQRRRVPPVLPVRGQQRLRLDRVAEPGAGAVRLDHVHAAGGETGVGQGLPDHPLLGGPVGGAQAVGGAVLVDRAAADHGEDRVAVAPGVAEPFQQQHADALGPAGAVGGGRERLAPPVGGEAALPGELDERGRGAHRGDPGDDGEAALPLPQRLPGQVQGDKRRRAGGVDGDRGPLQAEGVGDPAGHHAAGVAGHQVALQAVGGAHEHAAVVLAGAAGEDPGPAAAQGVRIDPGALEHLPGGLQQPPLLRVHGQRLARRDGEEAGVEVGEVGHEAAPARVRGAGLLRVAVVQRAEVPAPVRREVGDDVPAGRDHLPQVLR
ncbi:hypothetical protein B0E53_05409 [Micromonospora sp. MH33]|nr:hypothetical protein B0E53_05409 [Micromonospora sp. MH33]